MTVNIALAQAPINDEPCAAIPLAISVNCNAPQLYNMQNATHSTPNGYLSNSCTNAPQPRDVWFSFKTSNNNTSTDTKIAITAAGSSVGQIRLFTGQSCAGPLSEITQICNGTSNTLQLIASNLVPNTTYYILVSEYWANTILADFTICVTPSPVTGCTNPLASNYNSAAAIDNGSCIFTVPPINTCGVFSSQPNAFISNNQVVQDVINVSMGQGRVITDLDVIIKLNHTFISDLHITLTSPSKTTIDIVKNICLSSDDLEVRFDDNAYPLQCSNPTKGYYRLPMGSLAVFNNEPINGDWTLKIYDSTLGDDGVLVQWCLVPQTRVVQCNIPIQAKVVGLTPNSATIDWQTTNTPAETTWNIEYGPKGFVPTGVPNLLNITTKPYKINGLIPKTAYDFYVQAVCQAGINSGWSNVNSFNTPFNNGECGLNLIIPDQSCNATNNFTINVQNVSGTQLGNDVRLQEVRTIIRHTWLSDLSIYLISPSGKKVELSSKNGLSNDNYGNPDDLTCKEYTAFVQKYDCAAATIIDGKAPFIGKFLPEGDLATFHDSSNPNGNWVLQICDDAANDIGKLEFVELVFSNNNCLAPNNLSINNLKSQSLTLSWTSNNSACAKTIIEYGQKGFTPGTNATAGIGGTIKVLNCPINTKIDTVTGLAPNTDYDFYIREECSPNVFSPNACPIRVQTKCTDATPTLVDNFDNQITCISDCNTPCTIQGTWKTDKSSNTNWLVYNGSTPSASTGPDDDVTGGKKYLYVEAGSNGDCVKDKKAILSSQCIKVQDLQGQCNMSFYYHQFGDEIGRLSLEVSITNNIWQPLWQSSGNKGNQWLRQHIDLSPYNNEIVQLRFVYDNATGAKADLALDQIEFYGPISLGNSFYTFYKDNDGDGFGNNKETIERCGAIAPAGYVTNALDCNDFNSAINPAQPEIPANMKDENCNGMADDSVLPTPAVNDIVVCEGAKGMFYTNNKPIGKLYWYDKASPNAPIHIGDTLVTANLIAKKSYLVKDSILIYPGPRITELNFGVDAIEIQNIGPTANFTGWYVALGVSNTTSMFPVNGVWNLGNMSANEIQFRTKLTSNNFFGVTFDWTVGMKGWAMIVDNNNEVRDFVIWETTQADLDNFSATIKGKTFTRVDLPWSGVGVKTTVCSLTNTTMNLTANGEKNNQSDYTYCITNTMGMPNLVSFNVLYPCVSPLKEVQADIVLFPKLTLASDVETCQDALFDVRNIPLLDENNTIGTYSYHSAIPTTTSNELSAYLIKGQQNTTIFVKKTTQRGACSSEKSVPIKVNQAPQAFINTTTTAVCGNQLRTLKGSYLGGSGSVTYLWNTGAATNEINAGATFPNANGIYILTVTDQKGCQDTASIDISKGAGLTGVAIVDVVNATNCTSNDGKITLNPVDGTPPYNFQWSGASSGAVGSINGQYSISNLNKGSYVITITDNSELGCKVIIPFVAINSPEVDVVIDTIWNVTCNGQSNGKIVLKSKGNTNVNYSWSNGMTTPYAEGLKAGKYSVTITNDICTQILNNIEVKEPESLGLLSAIITDVSCTSNGKIVVTPKGGTPSYKYNWNNLATTKNLEAVSAGKYTLTITDAKNCSFVSNVLEVKNAPLINIMETVTNVDCKNNASGSINIEVIGGARPYTFKWSNGAETKDLKNVRAGVYKVSVTDANDCQIISKSFTITEPAQMIVQPLLVRPSCQGMSDGQIQVTVSGGVMPYFYDWNIGAQTPTIANLKEGIYSVTIADANGCTQVIAPIDLKPTQTISTFSFSKKNETCVGKADANIELIVSGGTSPYQYLWNNNQKTAKIDNLSKGVYKLTVTDGRGCKYTPDSVVISAPQVMSVQKDSVIMPSCNGANDGKIYYEVKGGTTPYNFKWSNNVLTSNNLNIKSNTYFVSTTDVNGCRLMDTIFVAQPDKIAISINTLDSISCFGDENACLDLNVSGGTAPYRYFWNVGNKTEDLCGVPAGDYKVTILDKNNCVFTSGAIIVPSPAPLKVNLKNNTGRCSGTAFGSIDIEILGGSPPYKVLWSNGATTEDLTDVPSGTYSVVVTDSKACKSSINNIIIRNPLQRLRIDQFNKKDISCNNAGDGKIEVLIAGGEPPYAYNWSRGFEHIINDKKDSLIGLNKGLISVVVTDNIGCVAKSDTLNIVEPDFINILTQSIDNPMCKDGKNGMIDVRTSGGTPPYKFLWSNNTTQEDLTNVGAGSYRLTVTDARGCIMKSSSYFIQAPDKALTIRVDNIKKITCKGGNDGAITLATDNAVGKTNYQWSHNFSLNSNIATQLFSGFYHVTVSDSVGCVATLRNIGVTEPSAIGVVIDSVITSRCKGENNGAIYVSALGGTSPYRYLWSNFGTNNFITNISDGKYTVTITDKNNCIYNSEPINIDSGDSLKAAITTIDATLNQNNGAATVSVSGGKQPYQYLWSDALNQTTRTAVGLPVGKYQVTVTDANRCQIVVKEVNINLVRLKEVPLQGSINLYPNPTDGQFFIEYDLETPLNTLEIQLINLLGEKIQKIDNLDVKQGKVALSLIDFPKGVYFIKIVGNQKVSKILKLVYQ